MLGLEVPLLQQENQKACLESVELASQEGEFDGQDGELGTMEGELESQEVELESQEKKGKSQELVLEPQVVELSDSDEPAGTQYSAEECLELAPDQNIESEEPAIDSEIVEIPVVKIPIEVIDILSSPESCSDIELDQTSFEEIPCKNGETTPENVVDHEDISHKDTGGNILDKPLSGTCKKTKTTVINTTEEDEVLQLRLIALRSAVMKKHLERKKRGIRIRTKRQQARETLIYPPDIPLPPTNREQGDKLPSNGPHQSDSSGNTEPDEITTIVDMELADTDDEKDMSKPTTDQEAIHWNSNIGEPTMYSNEPIWESDCPRYNAGPPFNNDGMLVPHDYENTFYRTGMRPHEYYQDPGSPHIPAQFYPASSDVYSKCPPIPTGEPGELVALSINEEHLHKMPAIQTATSTAENSAITKKSVVDYVKECLKDILETTKKHKSNAKKVSTPSHDGHVLTTNENGASPINAGEFIDPSSPVNVGASSQVKKDDDSLSTKMSSYIDRTSLVLSGSPEHVKPISSKYPLNYLQPSSPKQPNNTPSSILSEIQKQQDDDDELLLRERLLMALKCKNPKSLVDPLKAATRVDSMLADTTSINPDIGSTNTDTAIPCADTKLVSTVINLTQAVSIQSAYSPTQTVESLQRNFTYKRRLPPKCQQPPSGVHLARKRVNAARLTTKGGPALSLQVTVPTKEPPEPRKRFVICLGEESDSGTEEDPEMSHEFERSVEVFLRQAREKQEAQTIQGTTPISIRSMPLSQQQEYRRLRDQIAKLEESNHQQRLRLASKNIKAQLPLSPNKKVGSSVPLQNMVIASSHTLKQINLPNDKTRTKFDKLRSCVSATRPSIRTTSTTLSKPGRTYTYFNARGRGTRTISKPYFTNKFAGRRVSASKGLVVTIPGAPPNAGRSKSSLLVQEVSPSLKLSDVSDVAEKNGTCNESWSVTNTNKDEVLKMCHDGHSSSEDCVSSINKNREAAKEETSDEMDVDSILATNVVKSSNLATCKDGLAKSEINERSSVTFNVKSLTNQGTKNDGHSKINTNLIVDSKLISKINFKTSSDKIVAKASLDINLENNIERTSSPNHFEINVDSIHGITDNETTLRMNEVSEITNSLDCSSNMKLNIKGVEIGSENGLKFDTNLSKSTKNHSSFKLESGSKNTCMDSDLGINDETLSERNNMEFLKEQHLEDLQTQLTDVEQKLLKQRYAVLDDMTVTLDLLNQLEQERSNKDILSEEVKRLRAQLLSAEGRLAQQRKVLQTVRTQTSESYHRVVEGKTACLGLSRQCLMLGISLRGKQYKVPTAAAKIMILKLHQLAKLSQRLKRRSGGEENVITREPPVISPSVCLAQKQVESETQNLSSTIHETRLVSCTRAKQTDVSISCSEKTQNMLLLDEQGLVGDKVMLNANSFEYIPFSSKNSANDEELTYEEPATFSLSSNCLALEHPSESSASGTIYRDKVLGLDIDPSRTSETSWTLPADWIHTRLTRCTLCVPMIFEELVEMWSVSSSTPPGSADVPGVRQRWNMSKVILLLVSISQAMQVRSNFVPLCSRDILEQSYSRRKGPQCSRLQGQADWLPEGRNRWRQLRPYFSLKMLEQADLELALD
uniref:(California timema) hypothetical protein n=1 Tax=Timema californicum TaxID=61474 RepID=A0A7R9P9T7_TIMCA|nr:unnamed protein product [Timema californicum]